MIPAEEWQPQPSRKLLGARMGVCACDVCGFRAFKAWAMLSGWDSFEAGAVVICRWCRRRLGIDARELAQSGGGKWESATHVYTDSLVRHRASRRWARVVDAPAPGVVRFRYEGIGRRHRLSNATFFRTFEVLSGPVRGRS